MTGAIPALDFLAPTGGFIPDGGNVEPDVPAIDAPRTFNPPDDDDGRRDDDGGDELFCDVCGGPLTYSGRGRKPKRHKECRQASRTASTGDDGPVIEGSAPVKRVRRNEVEKLTEDLCQGIGEMAGMLGPMAPVTAVTMGMRGPAAMEALVSIAVDWRNRGHPGMYRGLELFAQAVPYTEVASFTGAIIYAMGVDAGRLPPEGMIADQLGVTAAVMEIEKRMPAQVPEQYVPQTVDGTFSPRPPAFVLPKPKAA